MAKLDGAQHLIIAGTNKSGTTAVFRYLGEHPEVILSKFKESEFFLRPLDERDDDVFAAYQSQFLDSKSDPKLYVEATPQYLPAGKRVAERIGAVLPDAKILFVLRNPADRVISYFRSSFGQPRLATYGVDFDTFVEESIAAMRVAESDLHTLSDRQRAFRQELRISRYAQFLPDYVEQFGAQNVLVTFFDRIVSSPQELMSEICDFAGIDPGFYDDFVFRVENKTRFHRSSALRRLSGTLNYRLEPLLNRYPFLRRTARSMYDLVNVQRGQAVAIPDASRRKLENFCAPWNAELADWMRTTYPGSDIPDWRTETTAS